MSITKAQLEAHASYLHRVPELTGDLVPLVAEDDRGRTYDERGNRLTRDQRRKLDRAVNRIKRRIRLERELWEAEFGPVEIEPPPAF